MHSQPIEEIAVKQFFRPSRQVQQWRLLQLIVNSIHILILFNLNIGKVLTDVLYQLLEGTVSLFPPFHAHNPFTSHHQQVFLIRIEITRAPLSFQFSAIPGGVVCSSGIEQIEEVLEITVVPKRNVKSTIISLIQLIVIELPFR